MEPLPQILRYRKFFDATNAFKTVSHHFRRMHVISKIDLSKGGAIMSLPQRKNVRLAPSNYIGDGYYFVTVCVDGHRCILGKVNSDMVELSTRGQLVADCLAEIPRHFTQAKLIASVVMPNHIHFILKLENSLIHLGRLVGAFKAAVSRKAGHRFWQRGYHEHIIQQREEYEEIIKYIRDNPARWAEDKYFIG